MSGRKLAAMIVLCTVLPFALGEIPSERLILRLAIPRGSDRCRSINQGYVVVLRMGVYGRVCTTGWDLRDANVVCRQLGFAKALPLDPDGRESCTAIREKSYDRYWLSNVQCHGNETDLAQCEHDGWGVHDCPPRHHAMVRCTHSNLDGLDTEQQENPAGGHTGSQSSTASPACTDQHLSAVRLLPMPRLRMKNSGFLQVRVCNEWKAVCGDGWRTSQAGDVACRQLGFPGVALLFLSRPLASDRRREAWLMRPVCNSKESFLHQCTYQGRLERKRCHLWRVAGVVCKASPFMEEKRKKKPTESVVGASIVHLLDQQQQQRSAPKEGDVRLRGGSYPSEGRVEVFHGGEWGVVCDAGWSLAQANVVCRQLGLGSAFGALRAASRVFGRGYSRIHLDFVVCTGREQRIGQCRHAGWGQAECDRERIAAVRCHAPKTTFYRQQIRLQTLDDGVHTPRERRRGLLQVKVGDRWGPVCADQNWNLEAGSVACRQLGYGYVHSAFTTTQGCPTSADEAATVKPVVKAPPRPNLVDPLTGEILEVIGGEEDIATDADLLGDAKFLPSAQPSPADTDTVAKGGDVLGDGASVMTGLLCDGQEMNIDQCTSQQDGGKGFECPDCKYAAVDCAYALPDLIPDLHALEHSLYDIEYHTLASLQCAYEEGCLSSSADAVQEAGHQGSSRRALLRFTVTILNFGTAHFKPVRERASWIWHACHNHYHSFDNFAQYDLLDHSGNAIAEGHKASFCLEDTHCTSGGRTYFSCLHHRQGISQRCSDIYGRDLDCQWIDITDIADGTYTLRISTNPNRLAAELDFTNNIAKCRITLTSGSYDPHYVPGTVTNVTCTVSHLQ